MGRAFWSAAVECSPCKGLALFRCEFCELGSPERVFGGWARVFSDGWLRI